MSNILTPHPLTASIFSSDLKSLEEVAAQYQIDDQGIEKMMKDVGIQYDEGVHFQLPVGIHKIKLVKAVGYSEELRGLCPAVELIL